MPSTVFFDLSGLSSAGGDDGALVPAFDQLATQFDGAAFDAALIEFG